MLSLIYRSVVDNWIVQRATPPGKCHSCNIRETPEWRRGPDGARTLCNACGLREFPIVPFTIRRASISLGDVDRLREADAEA